MPDACLDIESEAVCYVSRTLPVQSLKPAKYAPNFPGRIFALLILSKLHQLN